MTKRDEKGGAEPTDPPGNARQQQEERDGWFLYEEAKAEVERLKEELNRVRTQNELAKRNRLKVHEEFVSDCAKECARMRALVERSEALLSMAPSVKTNREAAKEAVLSMDGVTWHDTTALDGFVDAVLEAVGVDGDEVCAFDDGEDEESEDDT